MKQSRASLYKKIQPIYRCLICETDVFVENKQGTCPNCSMTKKELQSRRATQEKIAQMYQLLLPASCRQCEHQNKQLLKCDKRGKFYEDCDDFDHGIILGMAHGGRIE